VPDLDGTINLTGKLGQSSQSQNKIHWPLSRLKKKLVPKKYDLLVILSGPEPQRGMLEKHLKAEIVKYNGTVIFIEEISKKNKK
jgi:hypothetical protein